ncbi:hypothetical protein FRC12_023250 [Ceratobasidium sp. 428]|nr:hypothetical protein FRC12_023250 [Ceratobasidium sp. 428]
MVFADVGAGRGAVLASALAAEIPRGLASGDAVTKTLALETTHWFLNYAPELHILAIEAACFGYELVSNGLQS